MKYELCNGTEFFENDVHLEIFNTQKGNKIKLKDLSAELFKQLLEKEDFEIVEYISIRTKCSKIFARKQLNFLIYTLLDMKFIVPKSEVLVDNNKFNLKTVSLEITNGCNFRCPHCYVDKRLIKTLSFNCIKNIANELLRLNANRILLTGGEVLTHKDFFKIYKYLYKKGFIITINSNGSLINEEVANFFEKYPPISLQVSLYGNDEKTYCKFTKREKQYDIILKNLINIKNKGIKILCKNVLTNSNKSFFNKIVDTCRNLNIPFNSDYLAFPQLDGSNFLNPELVSPEEIIDYLKKDKTTEKFYLSAYANSKKNHEFVFACKKREDKIFIDCEKMINICPCMKVGSHKYKKGNLLECLKNLKSLEKITFRENSKCKDCRLMSVCRYCPAKFHLSTGDFQTPPDWFCKFGNLVFDNFIKGYRFMIKKNVQYNESLNLSNLLNKKLSFKEEDFKYNTNNCFVHIYYDGDIVGIVHFKKEEKNLELLNYEIKSLELLDKAIKYISKIEQTQVLNCKSPVS